MRPLHWALIQPDWYPQEKRKFGQRERERETRGTHSPRKGHVRIQGEGDQQQAKKKGLGRNQTCQHLGLRF